MFEQSTTRPPFSSAARSSGAPPSQRGSGTTSPCTRSRATPPSGKMLSRTCVKLSSAAVVNWLRVSPLSGEPDDGPVVAGLPAAAGLPAVVDLSLVAERVRVEHRRLRPDEVLPLGEQLIIGGDDAAADGAYGQVGQLGEVHGGHASPRAMSRPCGCSPTGWPRSQVRRTTPASGRPAYGVTGFLWCRCLGSTTNALSGAQTQKSASYPRATWPLRRNPANTAGRVAIQSTTDRSEWPRRRASVQTAGRPSCSDEMPPQATPKSPTSKRFSSGVQGE